MSAVFVNYRVGDGALIAGFPHRELVRAFGADEVFYAGRRLGPGSLFDEEIVAALRDCEVLPAIIGPRWLTVVNAEAEHDLAEALTLYLDLDAPRGRMPAGDHAGVERDLVEALGVFRRAGARGNEAWALNRYAAVFVAAGDHVRALDVYQDALRLTREVRQPNDEALALEGAGECHLRLGGTDAGVRCLAQALAVFERLGMEADVRRVRARLDRAR